MKAPGDLLGKDSAGESWSAPTFHTHSRDRAAAPWPRGKTDGGGIGGVWEKKRGGTGKRKNLWGS